MGTVTLNHMHGTYILYPVTQSFTAYIVTIECSNYQGMYKNVSFSRNITILELCISSEKDPRNHNRDSNGEPFGDPKVRRSRTLKEVLFGSKPKLKIKGNGSQSKS